ncbi:hypothetical protein MW887_006285 [Aspergillus wentii]|nr:hypothetical protein MW887_006285 [Aspergillus wentii]
MAYRLSIQISGPGEDPIHRSHWAFMIYKPHEDFGDLFDVKLIDLDKLWYQPDHRIGTSIIHERPIGMCKIANLDVPQRLRVIEVIKAEEAPRDGKRRCQDWVFDALISLEVEELVETGTAEKWKARIGKSAREL